MKQQTLINLASFFALLDEKETEGWGSYLYVRVFEGKSTSVFIDKPGERFLCALNNHENGTDIGGVEPIGPLPQPGYDDPMSPDRILERADLKICEDADGRRYLSADGTGWNRLCDITRPLNLLATLQALAELAKRTFSWAHLSKEQIEELGLEEFVKECPECGGIGREIGAALSVKICYKCNGTGHVDAMTKEQRAPYLKAWDKGMNLEGEG